LDEVSVAVAAVGVVDVGLMSMAGVLGIVHVIVGVLVMGRF
jgi:hypothetical protein